MSNYRHLVGKRVRVQNPNLPDTYWDGRVVALSEDPAILLEAEDGFRVMLSASWASLKPEEATVSQDGHV